VRSKISKPLRGVSFDIFFLTDAYRDGLDIYRRGLAHVCTPARHVLLCFCDPNKYYARWFPAFVFNLHSDRELNYEKGHLFGSWTFLGKREYHDRTPKFLVQCICGITRWVYAGNLIKSWSRSCGKCGGKKRLSRQEFERRTRMLSLYPDN